MWCVLCQFQTLLELHLIMLRIAAVSFVLNKRCPLLSPLARRFSFAHHPGAMLSLLCVSALCGDVPYTARNEFANVPGNCCGSRNGVRPSSVRARTRANSDVLSSPLPPAGPAAPLPPLPAVLGAFSIEERNERLIFLK